MIRREGGSCFHGYQTVICKQKYRTNLRNVEFLIMHVFNLRTRETIWECEGCVRQRSALSVFCVWFWRVDNWTVSDFNKTLP